MFRLLPCTLLSCIGLVLCAMSCVLVLYIAPLRAPKWYKRKAGVSFGFGGKLISFNSAEQPAGSSEVCLQHFRVLLAHITLSDSLFYIQVFVHNLVTEHGLISRSSEFEKEIQNGDKSALKLLCERKSQESEYVFFILDLVESACIGTLRPIFTYYFLLRSEDERETWGFMKVMFNEDGTARSKLLSHLGFSQPIEESKSEQNDLAEQVEDLSLDESKTIKTGVSGYRESALFATDNGEDFFNNLPSPKADTPVANSKGEVVGDAVKESHQEIDGLEESSDPSFDDAVQRALIVGDYKGAVAQCISANRLADALVISHVGGTSLWESTRDQYLKTSRSPYLKVGSHCLHCWLSIIS